jgi:hypothetical protein
MVVGFLAVACASGPRPSGGSGKAHPLAFHGREVDRQACQLEGRMEGEDLPVEFGNAEYLFHFELTGWPGMLAIRLRDGFFGMSFPDGRATIRFSPERFEVRYGDDTLFDIHTGDPRWDEVLAFFELPHEFVELDRYARVESIVVLPPPELPELVRSAAHASASYLINVPVLPGRARVGDSWTGVRIAFTNERIPQPEMELRYTLAGVTATDAVVDFAGTKQSTLDHPEHGVMELDWQVTGRAELKRSSGLPSKSSVSGVLRGYGPQRGTITFSWTCACDPMP